MSSSSSSSSSRGDGFPVYDSSLYEDVKVSVRPVAAVVTVAVAAAVVATQSPASKLLIDTDDARVLQPPKFKVQLKEHQLAVIYRAIQMEQGTLSYEEGMIETKIGVLCDYTGAGKSYSVLGLIASQKQTAPKSHKIASSFNSVLTITKVIPALAGRRIQGNLLIIPDGLLEQWMGYVQRTRLSLLVISRTADVAALDTTLYKYLYDLTIVTASTCRAFSNRCDDLNPTKNRIWSRVFYDEADTINIPNNPRFEANFWWFITATPAQLSFKVPNKGFISQTFVGSHRGDMIGHCYVKCVDEFVRRSFALPDPIVTEIVCKLSNIVKRIANILPVELLSALAAGDNSAAIRAIGVECVDSNEHILSMFTRSLREKAEEKQAEIVYRTSQRCSSAKLLEGLDKELKQLQEKIRDMEVRLSEDICYICYDEPVVSTFTKCCKKVSCLSCIMTYIDLKRGACQCPNCRERLTKDDLLTVVAPVVPVVVPVAVAAPQSKLAALKQWFESNMSPEKRVLFFSEFNGSFEQVIVMLEKMGIRYAVMTQHKKASIPSIIADFRAGRIQVLLANSFECGSGFNFENATDTLLYHKMGINRETQAIGRGQRPGRTSVLRITKFLYDYEMV